MGRSLKSFRRDGLLKLVSPQINPYGTGNPDTIIPSLWKSEKYSISHSALSYKLQRST